MATRPGEFYASHAAQVAGRYSAEFYEKTGEQLPIDDYRVLDNYSLRLTEQVIAADVARRYADREMFADPDQEVADLSNRIDADSQESRSRIIARYGLKHGAELLERTQRWVRTQPALARMLQQRGLGSKPEIVEKLVAHVFSNGIR